MVDFGSVLGSVSKGGTSLLYWGLIIIGVIIAIAIIGSIIAWWHFSKKKWNLRVEVKMTRSDGKLTLGEWAKGFFDAKKGVVWIKRAKMRKVPMRIIDIRRYLQGSDLLTVIQVGAEDYRPVLNDSWERHIVEYENEDGKMVKQREAILNIRVDTGINKAWKSAWDMAAKKAYSLQSFLQQFQVPIAIAIVLISCFVGFSILFSRMPSICK